MRNLKEKFEKTKWDIIPLDKMLSLKAVVNIFNREYQKINKDNDFFNRKSQRLREIYFSLFACSALDLLEKRKHFMFFYENQASNDVSFISIGRENNGKIQYFDVKEYVRNEDDLDSFLKKVCEKSQFKNYNLIVGLHEDGKFDSNVVSQGDKSIFIISATSKDSNLFYSAKVFLIIEGRVVFDKTIDLTSLIDPQYIPEIYHDRLKIN